MARNGVIGRSNGLPWRIPADLRHFRRLTMGHALVMGRRTFDSIGRALPGRETFVISRQAGLKIDGVTVVRSLDDALAAAGSREVFVVGGAEIYALALPRVARMHVTLVEADIEGDVVFPALDESSWRLMWEEPHPSDPDSPYPYRFQIYERLQPAAGQRSSA
jgi:dihydrofolate reductase